MQLFKIEGHDVVIDSTVRLIPEFKKIITKDKDRFKKLALKELFYVYHMCDYSSPYSIYGQEERKKLVTKDSMFEKTWTPDTYVKQAIDKYKELSETTTVRSVKAIKESLITSSKVIKAIQEEIEKLLEEADGEIMDDIIAKVEKLLLLSEKLPKAIDSLTSLEEKVKVEQSGNLKLKGGGSINPYEK